MRGLALLFTIHLGASAAADPWFSRDKAKHFFMSAFVESGSFSALRFAGASRNGALVGATVFASAVGVGKEVYDLKFGGDPSLKDLTWDGAGIAAAALVLRHTEP